MLIFKKKKKKKAAVDAAVIVTVVEYTYYLPSWTLRKATRHYFVFSKIKKQ
jgi:hypothetical protein